MAIDEVDFLQATTLAMMVRKYANGPGGARTSQQSLQMLSKFSHGVGWVGVTI
jgi:hypothetical protein